MLPGPPGKSPGQKKHDRDFERNVEFPIPAGFGALRAFEGVAKFGRICCVYYRNLKVSKFREPNQFELIRSNGEP